jgi:hypothetical protein
LCSLLARPFVCECHTISTMPRFQLPPHRTQHADFLALRSPVCFSSRLMGPIWPGRLSALVAVEQPKGFVQPLPTPPLPAEALSVLSPPHMAPDLLFYPVFDEVKALAGMPDREVVHPTARFIAGVGGNVPGPLPTAAPSKAGPPAVTARSALCCFL